MLPSPPFSLFPSLSADINFDWRVQCLLQAQCFSSSFSSDNISVDSKTEQNNTAKDSEGRGNGEGKGEGEGEPAKTTNNFVNREVSISRHQLVGKRPSSPTLSLFLSLTLHTVHNSKLALFPPCPPPPTATRLSALVLWPCSGPFSLTDCLRLLLFHFNDSRDFHVSPLAGSSPALATASALAPHRSHNNNNNNNNVMVVGAEAATAAAAVAGEGEGEGAGEV